MALCSSQLSGRIATIVQVKKELPQLQRQGMCPTRRGCFYFQNQVAPRLLITSWVSCYDRQNTCLRAKQPATEVTQNLIQFSDRCSITSLPSDCSFLRPSSLLEPKIPPLCLFLSNFPLSLVHSVSCLWEQTLFWWWLCTGNVQVCLQSCCF